MGGPDPTAIVQGLETAVAVADPSDWSIHFENGRFFALFPPDVADDAGTTESDEVSHRIDGFRADRATERLSAGRTFEFETESHSGTRTIPVRVTLRPLANDPNGLVVIEGADVSGEKEAQYMLDSYSSLAERNARELEKEKERVERLLLNIMPRSVLEEMKDYGTTTPERFEHASILMLDFVGFTDMAASQDPGTIITELNDIFTAFDRIVETFGCERLKTIGDAYIAVAGVPAVAPDHAQNIARVALRMRRYLERRNSAHSQDWVARFGINTGPVIGSLVGIQKYVYDIFGPGVNLATRMEQLSEPMRITVSSNTQPLLADEFVLVDRGEVDVKGFGPQRIFHLESEIGARRH